MRGKKIVDIMIRIIGRFNAFYCFVLGERINEIIFPERERSTPNIKGLFEGALK